MQTSLSSHQRSSEHSPIVENQAWTGPDENFGTGRLKLQRLRVGGQSVPPPPLLLQAWEGTFPRLLLSSTLSSTPALAKLFCFLSLSGFWRIKLCKFGQIPGHGKSQHL